MCNTCQACNHNAKGHPIRVFAVYGYRMEKLYVQVFEQYKLKLCFFMIFCIISINTILYLMFIFAILLEHQLDMTSYCAL